MTMEEAEKLEPYTPGPNAFDITPKQDKGVLKEVVREGEGEYTPTTGCEVLVHYVGRLTDGTRFDSSRKRMEPFKFVLGKGSVIKAWDIGVATMKKGEICMLTCDSKYAYGKAGSPPTIPADATLVFEIEMLSWQAEDLSPKKDGGILRSVLEVGEGHSTPNDGSTVTVHLTCECNGKTVEDREVTFTLGEGSEDGVPPGIDKAVEKFKLREKSKIELSAKYGWGANGKPLLGVPPNSPLVYTVTLKNFEKAQELWELTGTGKLEQGKIFKEKGTKYFKGEKFTLALKMYKKMIDYLEYEEGFEDDINAERKTLLQAAHLNAALCYLKLKEHLKARDQCDKALEMDSSNEKGLFRRGQAYLGIGEPEKARADFEAVLKVDANNKAAQSHVQICLQKIKEQKAKEKKIYANMFDKFAQRDREAEKKDWRFGWWDDDEKRINVEKMPEKLNEEDEETEEEAKRSLRQKRKFVEERARMLKERREQIVGEEKGEGVNEENEVRPLEGNVDLPKVSENVLASFSTVSEEAKKNGNADVKTLSLEPQASTSTA